MAPTAGHGTDLGPELAGPFAKSAG